MEHLTLFLVASVFLACKRHLRLLCAVRSRNQTKICVMLWLLGTWKKIKYWIFTLYLSSPTSCVGMITFLNTCIVTRFGLKHHVKQRNKGIQEIVGHCNVGTLTYEKW